MRFVNGGRRGSGAGRFRREESHRARLARYGGGGSHRPPFAGEEDRYGGTSSGRGWRCSGRSRPKAPQRREYFLGRPDSEEILSHDVHESIRITVGNDCFSDPKKIFTSKSNEFTSSRPYCDVSLPNPDGHWEHEISRKFDFQEKRLADDKESYESMVDNFIRHCRQAKNTEKKTDLFEFSASEKQIGSSMPERFVLDTGNLKTDIKWKRRETGCSESRSLENDPAVELSHEQEEWYSREGESSRNVYTKKFSDEIYQKFLRNRSFQETTDFPYGSMPFENKETCKSEYSVSHSSIGRNETVESLNEYSKGTVSDRIVLQAHDIPNTLLLSGFDLTNIDDEDKFLYGDDYSMDNPASNLKNPKRKTRKKSKRKSADLDSLSKGKHKSVIDEFHTSESSSSKANKHYLKQQLLSDNRRKRAKSTERFKKDYGPKMKYKHFYSELKETENNHSRQELDHCESLQLPFQHSPSPASSHSGVLKFQMVSKNSIKKAGSNLQKDYALPTSWHHFNSPNEVAFAKQQLVQGYSQKLLGVGLPPMPNDKKQLSSTDHGQMKRITKVKPTDESKRNFRLFTKDMKRIMRERQDRIFRVQYLKKDLGKLKSQENKLMRTRKDGSKDPIVAKNRKLQAQVGEQIELIKKVISDNTHYLEMGGIDVKVLDASENCLELEKSNREERDYSAERSKWKTHSVAKGGCRSKKNNSGKGKDKYPLTDRRRSSNEYSSRRESSLLLRRDSSPYNNLMKSELSEEKKKREVIEADESSNVRYEYYDAGNHWCQLCNAVSGNIYEVFQHLKSKKHQHNRDHYNLPWLTDSVKNPNSKPKEGPTQPAPFKGVELIMSTVAFYCTLCKEFSGDSLSAEVHLKSEAHNKQYQKYIEENPFYEKRFNLDKAAGLSRFPSDARNKQNSENSDDEYTKNQKRRKSADKNDEKIIPLQNQDDQDSKQCSNEDTKINYLTDTNKEDENCQMPEKTMVSEVTGNSTNEVKKQMENEFALRFTGKRSSKLAFKPSLPPWIPVTEKNKSVQKETKENFLKESLKSESEMMPLHDDCSDSNISVLTPLYAIGHSEIQMQEENMKDALNKNSEVKRDVEKTPILKQEATIESSTILQQPFPLRIDTKEKQLNVLEVKSEVPLEASDELEYKVMSTCETENGEMNLHQPETSKTLLKTEDIDAAGGLLDKVKATLPKENEAVGNNLNLVFIGGETDMVKLMVASPYEAKLDKVEQKTASTATGESRIGQMVLELLSEGKAENVNMKLEARTTDDGLKTNVTENRSKQKRMRSKIPNKHKLSTAARFLSQKNIFLTMTKAKLLKKMAVKRLVLRLSKTCRKRAALESSTNRAVFTDIGVEVECGLPKCEKKCSRIQEIENCEIKPFSDTSKELVDGSAAFIREKNTECQENTDNFTDECNLKESNTSLHLLFKKLKVSSNNQGNLSQPTSQNSLEIYVESAVGKCDGPDDLKVVQSNYVDNMKSKAICHQNVGENTGVSTSDSDLDNTDTYKKGILSVKGSQNTSVCDYKNLLLSNMETQSSNQTNIKNVIETETFLPLLQNKDCSSLDEKQNLVCSWMPNSNNSNETVLQELEQQHGQENEVSDQLCTESENIEELDVDKEQASDPLLHNAAKNLNVLPKMLIPCVILHDVKYEKCKGPKPKGSEASSVDNLFSSDNENIKSEEIPVQKLLPATGKTDGTVTNTASESLSTSSMSSNDPYLFDGNGLSAENSIAVVSASLLENESVHNDSRAVSSMQVVSNLNISPCALLNYSESDEEFIIKPGNMDIEEASFKTSSLHENEDSESFISGFSLDFDVLESCTDRRSKN